MAIYDVSLPLRAGMPTYPNEPGPHLEFRSRIAEGASANVSTLSLGSHTGTHIDAPSHFIEGAPGVESLSAEALVGPVYVFEHSGERHVTAADLASAGLPQNLQRLLIKTSNGRFWEDDFFHSDFIALASDAATWLVQRGMLLVGIDYLSIEQFRSPTHSVHKTLLEAGVVIVEGLDLRRVEPGPYHIACAPLNIVGAEGAPARVFLFDEVA